VINIILMRDFLKIISHLQHWQKKRVLVAEILVLKQSFIVTRCLYTFILQFVTYCLKHCLHKPFILRVNWYRAEISHRGR